MNDYLVQNCNKTKILLKRLIFLIRKQNQRPNNHSYCCWNYVSVCFGMEMKLFFSFDLIINAHWLLAYGSVYHTTLLNGFVHWLQFLVPLTAFTEWVFNRTYVTYWWFRFDCSCLVNDQRHFIHIFYSTEGNQQNQFVCFNNYFIYLFIFFASNHWFIALNGYFPEHSPQRSSHQLVFFLFLPFVIAFIRVPRRVVTRFSVEQ